ncbi:helicostatins [Aedes aegypti]|uniref:Preproallatostatin n=1 Tax=Aedes aegypti TaxID=7159 RepID=Q93103_AEDAE|nr:helicostatins [Aedes aegypti]AAB08870.1 preproallatostatin [Aedes aegypti]
MRPSTTPMVLLSYLAFVLCLACVAYGSSALGSSSGSSDQSLFGGGAGGGGGSASAESDIGDDRGQREISQATFQHMLAVRSPKYNFGLGKRRYIIEDVPGAKRLPHYNFGLGKRARNNLLEYDDDSAPSWSEDYSSLIPRDGLDYDGDKDKSAEKRASAYRYHFGLGKRRVYDFGLGKRVYEDKRLPNRYNFGLGKR